MNDFLSVVRFGERKAIHSSERPSARILSLPPGAFILLGILGRRPSVRTDFSPFGPSGSELAIDLDFLLAFLESLAAAALKIKLRSHLGLFLPPSLPPSSTRVIKPSKAASRAPPADSSCRPPIQPKKGSTAQGSLRQKCHKISVESKPLQTQMLRRGVVADPLSPYGQLCAPPAPIAMPSKECSAPLL